MRGVYQHCGEHHLAENDPLRTLGDERYRLPVEAHDSSQMILFWLIAGPLFALAIAFLRQPRVRLSFICAWAFWPSLLMLALTIGGMMRGDRLGDWSLAWTFGLFYQVPWWLLTLLPFKLSRRLQAISRGEA